ncbi:hypothetical protein OAG24_00480 [bacterium]|nr:hypothetical protein [bacterium]
MSEKEGNFEKVLINLFCASLCDPDFVAKLSQSPLKVRRQSDFGRKHFFKVPPKYGDACIKWGNDIVIKMPAFKPISNPSEKIDEIDSYEGLYELFNQPED